MLIYIFAEHYPNPYKPQFDTEFAYFIRQGHDIRIFVSGQYLTTLHPRVVEYGLDKMTSTFPTTLRTLPRSFGTVLRGLFCSPFMSFSRVRRVVSSGYSLKVNLVRAMRALSLPFVSPDLCYIHNLATASMVDFLPEIYPASKVFMYFHGGEVGGVRKVAREEELFGKMRVVLTNTMFSRDQAIERGADPERTIVAPVCFDLEDYPDIVDRDYRPGGVLRLISVGRLSEEKGLKFALEAIRGLVAQGLDNIQYTIVGRGMQERELKNFVEKHNLESYVTFAGELDKASVVKRLADSDVLLLPSLITETWAETQAAVVQEAMFMRLVVVGTLAGGVPESTAEIMRKFSIPVASSSAIEERVLEIMNLSNEEMSRLGEAGRMFAVNKFDIDRNGYRYLSHVCTDDLVPSLGV